MPVTLYVAWPAGQRTGRWLRRALDHALAALPGGAPARTLVSVLIDSDDRPPPPSAVRALLGDARRHLEVAPDLEASLAIDPRVTAAGSLAAYRAAGINRVALRAGVLDAAQAMLAEAAKLFPRCALDLTFGRHGQSCAGWRAELDLALQLGVGHISVEEHVAAQDEAGASDLAAELYLAAIDQLSAAGLPPYEIAHFSRPGQEARQLLHGATGGDYLGIGPGAVGRITAGGVCRAFDQIGPARAWRRAVETGAEVEPRVLSAEQRRTELLLTGLRLRAGVARAWFEPLAGPLEAALDSARLAALIEDGFVELDRQGLRLTERGWPLCDGVATRLLGRLLARQLG